MPRSLTRFLEKSGAATSRQIQEARRSQRFFSGSLLYNLVRLKILDENGAKELLAEWMGYPYAPLEELNTIPQQVLSLVQHGVVARRRVLPFQPERDKLCIASARIGNDPFYRDLQTRVGLPVVPYSIMEEHLEPLLERYYGIPAPNRETVRLAKVDDPVVHSFPASPTAPLVTATTSGEPEVGLDGLPINSDVAPSQLLPTDSENPMALFDALETIDDRALAGSNARRRDRSSRAERPAPMAGAVPALERLARARDREEVGQAAVDQALALGPARVGLVGIHRDSMLGWHAGGAAIILDAFQRLNLSLQQPSIFTAARNSNQPYSGAVPDLPANRELIAALGGGKLPARALLAPVQIKARTVAMLYADAGPGAEAEPCQPDALQELAGKVAAALEILLLRRKILG